MLKVINCNNENYKKKLFKYLQSDVLNSETRVQLVSKIIREIKRGKDKSLINLTKKYDNNDFKNIKEIEVTKSELSNSLKYCSKEFLKSTRLAIKRIKSYQKKLLPKNLLYKDNIGVKLGC